MISIVITLGPMPEDRRSPVLRAVRENLENPGVAAVHLLSEADVGWLPEALGELASRLHVVVVAERPLFSDLFSYANDLLADGAGTAAIMNADISFGSAVDVSVLGAALAALSDDTSASVVFALSRHETGATSAELPEIRLYDHLGYPNFLSADCWAFREPVQFGPEVFYAPGQMNCDMFLAYDLLASGCRVFNPCLDVVLKHHEEGKGHDFYDEANRQEKNQQLLERHIRQNRVEPFNYYGIPWVKTDWLRRGYRPVPASTNGKRFLVLVREGREAAFVEHVGRLAEIAREAEYEVHALCEGPLDPLTDLLAKAGPELDRVVLVPIEGSVDRVRKGFMAGEQGYFHQVAFIGSLAQVTPGLLKEAKCIVCTLDAPAPPKPDGPGCTLITSVFKSDPFLRGFINNSRALEGYGTLIDHVFLVADMSEFEIDTLLALLDCEPRVTVFWNRADPGLYDCWNLGLRVSDQVYVSNANVDDLRDPRHVLCLVRDLETHPRAMVAATALNPFYDYPEDGTLPKERAGWYADRAGTFGYFDIGILPDSDEPRLEPHNMPHCMPVWRRSLHDRYGYFNETYYGTYADWAFWLKVLQDGGEAWMNREALGFYFVNPTSHNRRGTDLERLHKLVEDEFLPAFVARRAGSAVYANRYIPEVPRKLNLTGRGHFYGVHRNSFNTLIDALDPLNTGTGSGVKFVPFLERYFVWGSSPGEAASHEPRPITEDWIGILHVPFDAPEWFNPKVSPEVFFETSLWQDSRPACRGIITLCDDLELDLRAYDPTLETLAVRHPTDMNVTLFDPAAYLAHPRVVQVGDWLRKLQAIHNLRAPGHDRVMLLKRHTADFLGNEVGVFGDQRDPAVDMREMVPNEEYDALLSSSVVLCLMYATAANNVVVECIARATPLLINPLPAVLEYLGADYPLYARDEAEADELLATPGAVEAAHRHLLQRRLEIDLTYEGFCRDVAASEFYERL